MSDFYLYDKLTQHEGRIQQLEQVLAELIDDLKKKNPQAKA